MRLTDHQTIQNSRYCGESGGKNEVYLLRASELAVIQSVRGQRLAGQKLCINDFESKTLNQIFWTAILAVLLFSSFAWLMPEGAC